MGAAECKCMFAPQGPMILLEQVMTFEKVTRMKFPMYVMKLEDSLTLQTLEAHSDLLVKGDIVEVIGGMLVLFISHQWIGLGFPDLRFEQFVEFQRAVQGLMKRSQRVIV